MAHTAATGVDGGGGAVWARHMRIGRGVCARVRFCLAAVVVVCDALEIEIDATVRAICSLHENNSAEIYGIFSLLPGYRRCCQRSATQTLIRT